jgi:hypothetical protein
MCMITVFNQSIGALRQDSHWRAQASVSVNDVVLCGAFATTLAWDWERSSKCLGRLMFAMRHTTTVLPHPIVQRGWRKRASRPRTPSPWAQIDGPTLPWRHGQTQLRGDPKSKSKVKVSNQCLFREPHHALYLASMPIEYRRHLKLRFALVLSKTLSSSLF